MAIDRIPAELSFEAFRALPEDTRAELMEGCVVMTPAPTWRHQRLQLRLAVALETFVRSHRLGAVVPAPFDVILRQEDPAIVVQPDVIFVARERMGHLQESGLFGVPDLVIEVLSPSNARYDSIKKRDVYGKYGVSEYWMILTDADQIEVLRREGEGGFGRPVIYEADDRLTTPLLPGFELSLAELFEPEAFDS